MSNSTLEKLENALKKHDVRPCDFWDNINKSEWDNMLNILSPMTYEQMESFLVNEGYC